MSTGPTPERKAFDYIESLGFNSVYNEAVSKRNNLESAQKDLLEKRQQRRNLEIRKQDMEMEVIAEERAKHPDMSAAAMEKHLKVAFSNHGDIYEARDSLVILAGEIERIEYEIELLHQDIKIAVARLHELSGYCQFVAVIKQAEETRKVQESRENGNPW